MQPQPQPQLIATRNPQPATRNPNPNPETQKPKNRGLVAPGHAGSYVALNVLKNRLEREELEQGHAEQGHAARRADGMDGAVVEQLPEAMTRGATVCVAASAGIAELDEYTSSRRAFEFGCGAGVWMVTWQHQARVGSALHDAMLEWKNTAISTDTATVVAGEPTSDELTTVADRIGPCAGEPNINYPQW